MDNLSHKLLEDTAKAYEMLLVPALFRDLAYSLANKNEIKQSHKVLDVACGTGVLARAVDEQINDVLVTGLDLNPHMLSVARQQNPSINWQQGKAEELPFEDETFDIVLCQFGLMFFSSPETALKEMNRVLKNGGYLILSVFDTIDNIPAYQAMADLFERKAGSSVAEALRFPFTMGDTEKLHSLFSSADLQNAAVTNQKGVARFSNIQHMVLSDVKGWFPFAQIDLDNQTIESIVRDAESILEPYLTDDGSVEFNVSVHVVKIPKI